MFPGAGASVYYNEDGEPLGWDYESRYGEEPYDPDDYDGPEEPDEDEPEGHLLDGDNPTCPVHHTPLTFSGKIGAPGYGNSWSCQSEDHSWVEIGGWLYAPGSMVHILSPEEVE